jgi:LPPG:FO 2-phospho-L-lactate transferase
MTRAPRVVALSGGVGGARLVDGLAAVLPPDHLTIIANTGDDFDHWGLRICPDLDTIMYTLAGLAHPDQGWGLAGETWNTFTMMERLGGPLWFRLGDRDLATHLTRTDLLRLGTTLTAVTAHLCRSLSLAPSLLPMSDTPRPTLIDTPTGTLTFQDWLVRHRAAPPVTGVRSANRAAPSPAVLSAISAADLILIGPSNPYVSIDPILTLDGLLPLLAAKPIIAVSPIVGGRAIKGPLATMIPSLTGQPPSPSAIATHYATLLGRPLSALIHESGDPPPPSIRTLATRTIMPTLPDRVRLAQEILGTGSWV